MGTSKDKVWRIAGLAIVGIAYIGGVIGWTWAVQSVPKADDVPTDSTTAFVTSALAPPADAAPIPGIPVE